MKRLILIIFIVFAAFAALPQGPPPPPDNLSEDNKLGADTPPNGGASIGSGVFVLILIGAGYLIYKQAHGTKKDSV